MNADVLLVDADVGMQGLQAGRLRREGHAVEAVGTATAATVALRARDIDVLVTDAALPDAGILPFLRTVSQDYPACELVVTADHPERRLVEALLEHGAFEVLEHPIASYQLCTSVGRAVERGRARMAEAVHHEAAGALDAVDGPGLARRIAEVASRVMHADDVSLMIPWPDGRLRIAYAQGVPPEVQAEASLALGERIAGRIAADRRPAVLAHALGEDPRFGAVESLRPVRSSIVYPVLLDGQLLGVLTCNRIATGRPFRQADLDRAGLLAAHVARVLRSSELLQELLTAERLGTIGRVAAGLAHEIDRPLSSVREGAVQVRERVEEVLRIGTVLESAGSLDEVRAWWHEHHADLLLDELRHAAASVRGGATRVGQILEDLRTLTAAERGEAIPLDVNEAVRLARRIVDVDVPAGARIELELGHDAIVLGHAGRLAQAVAGLLTRACGAIAGSESRPGAITVRTAREGDWVTIRVSDGGPPLPEERHAHLFEPFAALDRADDGTGLHASWEIARRMGGQLRLESSTSRGTTFLLQLPAASALDVAREPGLAASAVAGSDAPAPAGSRPRILFVDDEPAILRLYARAFGRDADVVIAEGGFQALARLEERQDYDAIVSDVMMPDIGGDEVFRRVRARFPELAPCFVFVTGSVADPATERFLEALPNPVLGKPFDFLRLKEIIAARRAARA